MSSRRVAAVLEPGVSWQQPSAVGASRWCRLELARSHFAGQGSADVPRAFLADIAVRERHSDRIVTKLALSTCRHDRAEAMHSQHRLVADRCAPARPARRRRPPHAPGCSTPRAHPSNCRAQGTTTTRTTGGAELVTNTIKGCLLDEQKSSLRPCTAAAPRCDYDLHEVLVHPPVSPPPSGCPESSLAMHCWPLSTLPRHQVAQPYRHAGVDTDGIVDDQRIEHSCIPSQLGATSWRL